MSLKKVIETARNELGVTENPPGSNRVKYWDDYDPSFQGQPWCVAFLWWVFQQAGERMSFFGGGKTASCGTLLRWYREQGLTVPVEDVQPGDIVILNFSGTQDTQHCGLVVDKHLMWKHGVTVEDIMRDNWTYQEIITIEGNTSSSDGSQSNGGMVCEKTRYPSQVIGVCRPQYKPDDPQPVDDVTGHWAKASIEWAMEKGLIKGYPDGSFKPNNPLTRAEACAILERFYELLWDNDMR